jgi:fermentation-respiration switch protein FrsA (DUF1100 family)
MFVRMSVCLYVRARLAPQKIVVVADVADIVTHAVAGNVVRYASVSSYSASQGVPRRKPWLVFEL